ncbi:FliH/SctL family protein [Chitinibacteraceae bacterium HSL-7]
MRLCNFLDLLPGELDRLHIELGNEAASIALVALTRIVGEHALDRTNVIATVRRVIEDCKAEKIACVHLAPADYEFLVSQNISLSDSRIMRIAPNPKIMLGGCIIDTEMGSLDARFETQLLRVKEALARALVGDDLD